MVDDIPSLTVEILKQIRDGVHRTNERLEQGFAETNRRLSKLEDKLSKLEEQGIETNKRLATVEHVVLQHGRIVDGVLETSLEDSNRFDVLEGRVSKLEADMASLRAGAGP